MKNKLSKKQIFLIVSIIFIALLIMSLFGAKIYLYLNMLIGNDLVVQLTTDQESLNLQHYEQATVEFKTQVITNAFCTAKCECSFTDLSRNKTIDTNNFTLNPTGSMTKDFTLTATQLGSGQELYRFEVNCKNTKTFLCHTKEEEKVRNVLISLNYNLNENEQQFKQYSKEQILTLIFNLNNFNTDISSLNLTLNQLNIISDTQSQLSEINKLNQELNDTIYSLKSSWESEEYNNLNNSLNSIDFTQLETKINETKSNLNSTIINYNNLIETLKSTQIKLEYLKSTNVTNTTEIELDSLIVEFNDLLNSFQDKTDLKSKNNKINKYITKLNDTEIETDLCCFANETINQVNLTNKSFIQLNHTLIKIVFNEPSKKCCFLNKCEKCCDKSCNNYPIIFLHGHAFNKGISAEYSLDTFNDLQTKLENEGYINAGSILYLTTNSSILFGLPNTSLTFKASYYFDIYKSSEKDEVIETKSDNIDTYAIRLKDIISTVKSRTNQDKVVIIAHSMGGLVVRRYLQVFGTENLDRAIFIGTPNKGIDSDLLNYCNILGSALECTDMSKDSLFINKLNRENITFPLVNIIGVGCPMGINETGDGIVQKNDATLDFAKNYYINGTCEGLTYLHETLLNTNLYPEVYKIINKSLKN